MGRSDKKKLRQPRKASSEDLQQKWLSEHFPYEVCMMRYGLEAMFKAEKKLDYNLAFECFIAKARVIHSFLANKAKHNDDIQAADFTSSYAPPSTEKIKSLIIDWNPHAAHASNKRPHSVTEKIDIGDCVKIAGWVETALAAFLEAIPKKMRENWSDERAGVFFKRSCESLTVEPTYSASSADPVISATTLREVDNIKLDDGGS